MKKTVLITGITGFIGSHIAELFVKKNIQVIGLKRQTSDTWRCKDIESKIIWVDIDEKGEFKEELAQYSFEIIVHSAWIGVDSNSRDDWKQQSKNLPFLISLLEVAKKASVKKFIFLGSQAEYGNIEGKISEKRKPNALNAYASIKLASLEIVKTYCELNSINWIWLRLFSLFGEKENQNWLIPSLVQKMHTTSHMDFTPGNQKYAYLFVNDFAEIMKKVITVPIKSGIYNISSNETRTIKSLVEDIRDYVNPEFILNFGVLKYRDNQSMHLEGDITKLISQIGDFEFTDFNIALHKSLNHYLNKY